MNADDTLATDARDFDRTAIGHLVDDRAETCAGEIDTGVPAMRQHLPPQGDAEYDSNGRKC